MRQEALVNPALLVWARDSINMDIGEAADKIGVKAERLKEWEDGAERPTVIQARKMSEVYRRPLAAFFLPEPPKTLGFSVPQDFRRLPTDQPRMLSSELIVELRRIEYLRNVAIQLSEEPAMPSEFVGTATMDGTTVEVAKRTTQILSLDMPQRSAWRTEYDALNGWKNAIEQKGVLVMHLNRVEMAEIRGIAIAEPIFPLIAVNGKDSPNGRIFTLLHEFAHLLLGSTGMSNLRLAQRPRTYEQRVEQFCNQVAGEVLVPGHLLLAHEALKKAEGVEDWSDETIRDIARFFKTSREVVVRRLLILGRASNGFYRMKRHQYAMERAASGRVPGGPIPMPLKIIRTIGQPFARIALAAYYREAITGSELSELLGARLKHLSGVQELLRGRNVLATGDRE